MNDSNDAASTTPRRSLGDRLRELSMWLPYLGWTGLIAWGLSHGVGWGFALLLAPVLGLFAWFLTGQMLNSGTNNLYELNTGAGIALALALVLTPVFHHARQKARQTTCLSNLKQQGLALPIYAVDNDDAFPPAHRWADTLHLPDTTFRCPESKAPFGFAFASAAQTLPEKMLHRIDTPVIYEGDVTVRNAVDAPPRARHDGREGRGHNVLFGDVGVR